MKRLILIESGEKYQFNTLEELIECIIDKEYYKMTINERKHKMELKAYANCLNSKVEIVDEIEPNMLLDGKFVILDEKTYVFSLLILDKIILLENIESNIFTEDLEKSNLSDNYIIVNNFAKDLLRVYLSKRE